MIRGIKSLSRRIDREFFPLFWHLGSFSGPSRVWRIHHYYDIPSRTKDEYVRGQGDPGNILAYLQFRAERDIAEDCSLLYDGAASLLCRFYGFVKTPYRNKRKAPDVDLYLIREERCGHQFHNLVVLGCTTDGSCRGATRCCRALSHKTSLKGGPHKWRPAV